MAPSKRATKKSVAKPKASALTAEVKKMTKQLISVKKKLDKALAKGSPLAADEVADCAAVRDMVQAGQAYLAEHCPIV
jgi:hypothetical protein